MLIPFHTNCREGWGCHPDCPVLQLAHKAEEQETTIANLERELQKLETKQKKKTNE